jgi:multicomponent Na+:H+ antiporter subunit F
MNVENYLIFIIMPILCLASILVFIRFIKGPNIVDRVIALDLLITIGVGIIGVFSVISEHSAFLDDAMILALIAFLGTIAFSYYLLKRKNND